MRLILATLATLAILGCSRQPEKQVIEHRIVIENKVVEAMDRAKVDYDAAIARFDELNDACDAIEARGGNLMPKETMKIWDAWRAYDQSKYSDPEKAAKEFRATVEAIDISKLERKPAATQTP